VTFARIAPAADFPPTDRPVGRVIGREIAACVAAVILHPFGRLLRARRTPRRAGTRTVVFVHGYLANGACFSALRAYLRATGVRPTLAYGFKPTDSVEAAAIGLKAFLKRHVRGGRIDLVCHSLGGLVALSYLAELGGARRVDRCIALGTPYRGTYNAYWLAARMGRDLRPGSPLLRRLQRSSRAARRVVFTSIVAESDAIVIPRIFAAAGRTVRVPGVGHTGLLFSPAAFRGVAAALECPLPRRSRPNNSII
jgi:pimeloyl-ACP methyl ester carboxylesterase